VHVVVVHVGAHARASLDVVLVVACERLGSGRGKRGCGRVWVRERLPGISSR
jgi:hypothetical protein